MDSSLGPRSERRLLCQLKLSTVLIAWLLSVYNLLFFFLSRLKVLGTFSTNFSPSPHFNQGRGKITPASTFDMDKLKSTLKQFVRDWSEEGKPERDSCYQPIISEIVKNFPKERW